MTEKQLKWQKRSIILFRLKGMTGFSFEEGVLTPLERNELNTALSIIRKIIRDSTESSIELGFNAKKRCFCGKPVVDGSEYCVEHKNLVDDNSSGF
jgi:hypothetical protein|nr:MAG TPA: GcrA cell cycle regulator [Crassvirales sp.]